MSRRGCTSVDNLKLHVAGKGGDVALAKGINGRKPFLLWSKRGGGHYRGQNLSRPFGGEVRKAELVPGKIKTVEGGLRELAGRTEYRN